MKKFSLDGIQDNGDFTPTVVGQTSAGVGTYSVQVGRYYRIGDIVCFTVKLVWSAHTGTGNMTVSLGTLPISLDRCVVNVQQNSIVVGTGKQLSGNVVGSTNTVYLYADDLAGGVAAQIAIDTAGTLYISGTYLVNL